nr:hypothetical protein [uncultured Kingella sp.]
MAFLVFQAALIFTSWRTKAACEAQRSCEAKTSATSFSVAKTKYGNKVKTFRLAQPRRIRFRLPLSHPIHSQEKYSANLS